MRIMNNISFAGSFIATRSGHQKNLTSSKVREEMNLDQKGTYASVSDEFVRVHSTDDSSEKDKEIAGYFIDNEMSFSYNAEEYDSEENN